MWNKLKNFLPEIKSKDSYMLEFPIQNNSITTSDSGTFGEFSRKENRALRIRIYGVGSQPIVYLNCIVDYSSINYVSFTHQPVDRVDPVNVRHFGNYTIEYGDFLKGQNE